MSLKKKTSVETERQTLLFRDACLSWVYCQSRMSWIDVLNKRLTSSQQQTQTIAIFWIFFSVFQGRAAKNPFHLQWHTGRCFEFFAFWRSGPRPNHHYPLEFGDGQFSERCDVDGSFFNSNAIPNTFWKGLTLPSLQLFFLTIRDHYFLIILLIFRTDYFSIIHDLPHHFHPKCLLRHHISG